MEEDVPLKLPGMMCWAATAEMMKKRAMNRRVFISRWRDQRRVTDWSQANLFPLLIPVLYSLRDQKRHELALFIFITKLIEEEATNKMLPYIPKCVFICVWRGKHRAYYPFDTSVICTDKWIKLLKLSTPRQAEPVILPGSANLYYLWIRRVVALPYKSGQQRITWVSPCLALPAPGVVVTW